MSYTLEKTIDLAIQAAVQKAKKEAILECRPIGSYFITETEDIQEFHRTICEWSGGI